MEKLIDSEVFEDKILVDASIEFISTNEENILSINLDVMEYESDMSGKLMIKVYQSNLIKMQIDEVLESLYAGCIILKSGVNIYDYLKNKGKNTTNSKDWLKDLYDAISNDKSKISDNIRQAIADCSKIKP